MLGGVAASNYTLVGATGTGDHHRANVNVFDHRC